MRNILWGGVFALISIFCLSVMVSCETGNGVKQTKALQFSPAEQQLSQHCNDFSFNLLAQAAANEQSENIILSPLSASMLLGMLMNGADGETLAQIREMLGFEDAPIDEINDYYRQLIDVLPALDQHRCSTSPTAYGWSSASRYKQTSYKHANRVSMPKPRMCRRLWTIMCWLTSTVLPPRTPTTASRILSTAKW